MLPFPECKSFEEYCRRKIIAPSDLQAAMSEVRRRSQTIASLNGSFDLLHAGHLEMIYQASQQANVLVIGLNSDDSIRRYKHPLRPIVPLKFRLQMIAALEMVDFVTWFEQTDPLNFIETVKPDVHVNGAEYGENCIEADLVKNLGARLHIVSLVAGLSTTNVIKKIREICV